MQRDFLIGMPIPNATLSYLDEDGIQTIDARSVFSDDLTLAIGIPGAFTPVCTEEHIPSLINNAEKLKQGGYDRLLCIASNDPFVLAEWASRLDTDSGIQFLSDGNLEFSRALGLTSKVPELFLGERAERYMIITRKGVIRRCKVEEHCMTLKHTHAEHALHEASDIWYV